MNINRLESPSELYIGREYIFKFIQQEIDRRRVGFGNGSYNRSRCSAHGEIGLM